MPWIRKRDTLGKGRNTVEWAREEQEHARSLGYEPLRLKCERADDPPRLVPTSWTPGFAGKAEKIYFSNWYKRRAE